MSLLGGCASQSYFVNSSLKDVSVSQIERLDRPRPAQLLFSFKVRGLVDTRTSEILEDDVKRIAASSGLFAVVDDGPAPGGAILNVTIEDFPGTEGEVSRGLASGLTFGLAGYTRADPFVCTVDYVSSPGASRLTTTAQHAILIPSGIIDSRPKDLVIAKSWIDALRMVTRQSATASLQRLSQNPVFRKEAQTP
jgi:hypothetical protein